MKPVYVGDIFYKIRGEVYRIQLGKETFCIRKKNLPSSSYLPSTLLGTGGTQVKLVSISKECSQTSRSNRHGNR